MGRGEDKVLEGRKTHMEYRDLGTTGMRVSEIGFGAWAIGGDAWGPVEDTDSLAAMERAMELGINFIDTADVYGDGRSESLVAKAIKGRRDEVILSTKGGLMGHHRDPEREPVYDRPEKIVEACEASLRRLKRSWLAASCSARELQASTPIPARFARGSVRRPSKRSPTWPRSCRRREPRWRRWSRRLSSIQTSMTSRPSTRSMRHVCQTPRPHAPHPPISNYRADCWSR